MISSIINIIINSDFGNMIKNHYVNKKQPGIQNMKCKENAVFKDI